MSLLGIFAIFFLKLYEGGLLTSLLINAEVEPFRDVKELAGTPSAPGPRSSTVRGGKEVAVVVAAGKAKYMVEATTSAESQLLNPEAVWLEDMRVAMQDNPYIAIPSIPEGFDLIRSEQAGEGLEVGEGEETRTG